MEETWKKILLDLGFEDFINIVEEKDLLQLVNELSNEKYVLKYGLFYLYTMESFVYEKIIDNFNEFIKEK